MLTKENIVGIEEASVEAILSVEADALKAVERITNKVALTNEDVDNKKWFEKVAFTCDYTLKQRGERANEDWMNMF